MTYEMQRPRYLRRIDLSRNMRRFYALSIQPTLFGGASVVRHWGRIGSNGQSLIETFDDAGTADCALMRLERVKRQRGYVDVDPAFGR
ncbi:WGR domain-containing protein [Bradyrhizobium sp. NAS96.2]|uniref:WGR domain-containing protein n=1 Tax=Bradyrhizobium sp. NAS96.2 TaxID=1680160 RepID=UPI00093E8150|nr:WGR domain-containing protein [Bradyrhizobium sp. NAS96.2]OKO70103.1 polymerase [Bradyrhizobium sp. NAS96.2]